jgi:predicted nucleic acid-binding protein
MARFLDTSVLLYSISTGRDEQAKREIAARLLSGRDNALSVQVLQEFYAQATRAARRDPLPHEVATALMRTWLRFPVQHSTLAVMRDAVEIQSASRLSHWDAAIVAAARALGCREILSEDMAHGSTVAGVRIINPFE